MKLPQAIEVCLQKYLWQSDYDNERLIDFQAKTAYNSKATKGGGYLHVPK